MTLLFHFLRRATLLLVFASALTVLASPVLPRAQAAAALPTGCSDLSWPAPALSSPLTINLSATGGGYMRLDNKRDYVVVLPSTVRTGQVQIDGGRNITVVGGSLRNYAGGGTALLYFTDNGTNGAAVPGRVIHVAHVKLDLTVGDQRDAIGLQTPTAVVQLQDVRAAGVRGTGAGVHGDIVQNYSPVRELRIDRFTGSTNYQGFFLRPQEGLVGNITLRRVNLRVDFNGVNTYSQALFLANPDGKTAPISFDRVHVENTKVGQTAQMAVYPDATAKPPSLFDGTRISFPSHPALKGNVLAGKPSTGDFACV